MRSFFRPYFRVLPRARFYISDKGARTYVSTKPAAGCFGRASFMVLLLILLATHRLWAQDTLLVEVHLTTTSESVMVEALLPPDSTLRLPAEPLAKLLGLGTPVTQWTTIKEIEASYPSVRVVWSPAAMRVDVFDPLMALPASKRANTEVLARTATSYTLPAVSSPYMALSVDDSSRSLVELGYSWRGRFAVAGRFDSDHARSLGLSVAPSSHLFLSYTQNPAQRPNLSGRVSYGPVWLFTSYTPHLPTEVSGMVRVRDVTFFSGRQYSVVTYTPPGPWAVSVAKQWEQSRTTAARVTWGPAFASPFAFPSTQLIRR